MANHGDLFGGAARKQPPARPDPKTFRRPKGAPRRPLAPLRANPAIPPPRSRCWRGWSRCAAAPACISAAPTKRRLHHLFAEVIDNAMDEAVAGHASFIDVNYDGVGLSFRHRQWARHSDRSASEISQEIRARSHHDDAARGRQIRFRGLSDLRRPAWRRRLRRQCALVRRLEVEVARGQLLYRQSFARGVPTSKLEEVGKAPNRRGTRVRFKPDEQIFGKGAHFKPARLFKMARAKAYLFGGVEIRWRCAPELARAEWRDAGGGGVAFSRRPQGLSGPGHRRQGARHRADLFRQGRKAGRPWLARMGARLAQPTTTASSIPIATPSRPRTAARMRRACARRCCAASRITPSGSARPSARRRSPAKT